MAAGKTYTMGSASSARLADGEQGILPRVIANVFDMIKEGQEQTRGPAEGSVSYAVRCQFLEIYGEDINDLLDPAGNQVIAITLLVCIA
jgi:hypothetical protein